MSVKGGPDIVTDGLVFNLDAAGAVSNKGYDPEGLRIEYLVVAGGGGGGGWSTAGGGGAGGLLQSVTKFSAGTYTVTVGAGGTRGNNGSSRTGSNGGDSEFGAIVAYGGGGGGSSSNINGLNGGSGGGGFQGNGATGIGGSGVSDQGNNGGNGGGSWRSGSGGGAGAAGTPGVGGYGSARGGIGKISRIDFNREYYAGGGASGGCANGDNSGGLGGGGNGGRTNTDGTNGQTNRGGGGGGGGCYNTRATFGGSGGSGIVILRYKGKQKATGGDSIVYKNGYTIHTFTSSGSFVLDETVDGLSTSKIVGTLENMGPSDYSTGNKGYFSFDGTNQYIQTPVTAGNLGISSAGGKFSIDIWYRDNSDGSTNRALFTTFRGYNATIEIHANSTYRFYVNIEDNNGDRALFGTANNSYASGEWVNGTLVWDGSVKTAYVYLNGELQGYNTNTLVDNTLEYYGDPLPFRIGSTIVPNYQYGALPLLGDVSSVKVYDNEALSASEILQNYNATKGRYGL